jgi:two-component system chemotaxis response regulator CheY
MKLRVLLVDDSPAMRSFIRRVLGASGVSVAACFEASNGAEALQLIRQSPVDIIVSDINMPVMDGESFAAELRERGLIPALPLLVVSTDSTCCRMQRMIELGARGYLRKPFTPEEMRAAFEAVGLKGMEEARN